MCNILLVYSPFSDRVGLKIPFSYRVGLPLHNAPFPGVPIKILEQHFLRPDALPDINHMCQMQYQIVLNKIFWLEII